MYKFNKAREALKFLVTKYGIKEIFIPYYLCDVIRHSLFEIGCNPLFYHIDDEFLPARTFPENSFILYPNYFGVCDKNVELLVQTYPNIIIDNAHSFYSEPKGFACFNSERKFHPSENNSYLWIKKEDALQRPKSFAKHPLRINRTLKFGEINNIYTKNNILKFEINQIYSPFCYPFLARTNEEADIAASNLERQGKTIYRYWNNLPQSYNEYKFYRRLVPIPLD